MSRWAAVCAALLLTACASLAPRPELPPDAALPVAQGVTRLDQLIGDAEARHPGQSGFRLVRHGPEAFALRATSAALAARSLDVQTYIWHPDLTGSYLALQLLAAADRGVQVRLLVDDMDARNSNYAFAALDAHPNIAVRMFNPFASRSGTLSLAFEALGSARRVNRRMHNKTWIADNRFAVAGGRNLGNEYFGAGKDVNFVDLDFAMAGPIVREASASFDRYWNSPAAYPMQFLAPESVNDTALGKLRERMAGLAEKVQASAFGANLQQDAAVSRLLAGDWPLHWTLDFEFIADDPGKALGKQSGIAGSKVLETMVPLMQDAERSLSIISPYFVPGKAGTDLLVAEDRAGVAVRVLTNSLAANDVAMVYGGYASSRKDLLRGGVELWELRPSPGKSAHGGDGDADSGGGKLFGSSGASLHTKALTADGHHAFVGSFNLDPRSTSLNCEQGIFVVHPEIAAQLEAIFAEDTAGTRAWRVRLVDSDVQWDDGVKTWKKTPEASASRKFQAWIARVLPISSQL